MSGGLNFIIKGFERALRAGERNDMGALGGKRERHGAANAAGGAGDEGDGACGHGRAGGVQAPRSRSGAAVVPSPKSEKSLQIPSWGRSCL